MKAEKGDLIRIVNAQTKQGGYKNGDIVEVTGRWTNGVIIDIDSPYNDIYDFEYVIHRKAGEESFDEESACANCGKQGVHTCRGAEYHAEQSEQDAVNHPNHYTQGKFETIEVIEEITKGYDDGFIAYCIGNTLKYIARAPFKHGTPAEDLRKGAQYLQYAVEYLSKREVD